MITSLENNMNNHYTGEHCPECSKKGDCQDVWVGTLTSRDRLMFRCSNPDCTFTAPLEAGTLFADSKRPV
jgi:hypothetical protein